MAGERVDTAKTPNGAVSVLVTDTQIVPANPNRQQVTICNNHATQVVYLSLGSAAAVASQGIRINGAGGSYTTKVYRGEIRGISVGGTSVCTFAEV